MRRTLFVLFVAVAAMLSLVGAASAAPSTSPGPDVLINSTVAAPGLVTRDVSAQALSCGSSNMCAWPVSDGSSSRCSWSNADPDWQSGSVTCSWSSSRAVWAVYNHGASTSYAGVCLYSSANYVNWEIWVARGVQVEGLPGVKIRSHKWVTGTTC
jgi:Peptidase inhibitor family I36